MYEDLVKQLRYCAERLTCRNCLWKAECCPTDMHKKAADAIEGLDDICQHQADEIRELKKAVLRLENESGIYDELPTFYIYPTKWIPVTERLPEDSRLVLVCDERNNFLLARHDKRYKDPFGIGKENTRYHMVKYWMPIPEPPKEGE